MSKHNYSPSFNTLAEFIAYLEGTLLPDLRESGSEGFVQDFEEAIYWMEMRERRNEDDYEPVHEYDDRFGDDSRP